LTTPRSWCTRDQPAQFRREAPAPYHEGDGVELAKHAHIHPDGTRHRHSGVTEGRGLYVAQVTFERPGPWGLEILARQGNRKGAASPREREHGARLRT
jgi:hypothetical protein